MLLRPLIRDACRTSLVAKALKRLFVRATDRTSVKTSTRCSMATSTASGRSPNDAMMTNYPRGR